MLKAVVLAGLVILGLTVDPATRTIRLMLDLGTTYSANERSFYIGMFCRVLAPPFSWVIYEVRVTEQRQWKPTRVDWGAVEACEEVRG